MNWLYERFFAWNIFSVALLPGKIYAFCYDEIRQAKIHMTFERLFPNKIEFILNEIKIKGSGVKSRGIFSFRKRVPFFSLLRAHSHFEKFVVETNLSTGYTKLYFTYYTATIFQLTFQNNFMWHMWKKKTTTLKPLKYTWTIVATDVRHSSLSRAVQVKEKKNTLYKMKTKVRIMMWKLRRGPNYRVKNRRRRRRRRFFLSTLMEASGCKHFNYISVRTCESRVMYVIFCVCCVFPVVDRCTTIAACAT